MKLRLFVVLLAVQALLAANLGQALAQSTDSVPPAYPLDDNLPTASDNAILQ